MKLLNHNFLLLLSVVLLSSCASLNSDITAGEFKKHIEVLASDEFGGRYPGSKGDILSASYIIKQFKDYKLDLLNDQGLQSFNAIAGLNYSPLNALEYNELNAKLFTDFIPYPYSAVGTFRAPYVFVGFGLEIQADSLQRNDYASQDVKGKWVMMFRGDPESGSRSSRFEAWSDDKTKIVLAKDKGALGVIMISPSVMEKEDELIPAFYDKSSAQIGIPVLNVSRKFAQQILSNENPSLNLADLEKTCIKSDVFPAIASKMDVSASIILEFIQIQTHNVVAYSQSKHPNPSGRFIVVGAHYDHLGMGGKGSGSRVPDTSAVHNGADDNASGVAGMIELAGKIRSMNKELRHDFLFVAFGAEELGLLGSKYFVDHLPVDKNRINAMVNFDMIGRLDPSDHAISISGTGTAAESESLLKELESDFPNLKFAYSPEGFGASDHSSFYVKDIPVYFISTGAHPDYHTPADDVQFINADGGKQVMDYTFSLIRKIDQMDKPLSFREAGPKEMTGGRRGFKVVLGIMPDFTGSGNEGLRVDYVREGGPAEKAGMLKGDVITAIDGMPVTNIQDYMVRLKKLIPGSRILVDVKRNESLIILTVDL